MQRQLGFYFGPPQRKQAQDPGKMAQSRQFICIPSRRIVGHTRHSGPTSEDVMRAENSDFFPSVSLAVVLFLIFISVLSVLFQRNTGYITIKKLSDVNGRAVQFHPLLYRQPLLTQLMVGRLVKNWDEGTIVLAAAEDATQTLECFSINIMAILSNQIQPFIKQVGEHKPPEAIRNHHFARIPKAFSVAVITRTKGNIFHGVILGPPSLVTGNLYVMEIKLQASGEQSTVLEEPLDIAIELLHHLYKSKPIPDTFEVRNSTRQQLGVIKIKGDPYLESGLVC
ncbi:uncharacterized protein LOC120913867 isoform X1 [Rana temporaria]|uniref:uncharacterized protein LOC120913867 isoform X1 n=2 Tax=Rana temporaria TaxID=8407 RepID=UPI001AAC4E19|nr:uncharacterized protein LOC120913867 isoform X1 [Rana temporaria]